MTRPTRKNLDVSRDRWDSLVRIARKLKPELPENPTVAEVLDLVEKAAKKESKSLTESQGERETPGDANTAVPFAVSDTSGDTQGGREKDENMVTRENLVQVPVTVMKHSQLLETRPLQPPLLSWTQTIQERRENRLERQLDLDSAKFDFQKERFYKVLEFKYDELEAKKKFLDMRAAVEERRMKWLESNHQRSLPIGERCTYCQQVGHLPVECPQLLKDREAFASSR